MTFDPTKPCRTKAGCPARVLCADLLCGKYEGKFIVAAITVHDRGEVVFTFQSNGQYLDDGRPHDNDLINIPEKHVRWLNIYKNKEGKFYSGPMSAAPGESDEHAIARRRIEFEEGQFDE